MDINGTQQFNAAPQQVWAALHDSATLQGCAAGGTTIAWASNNLVITGTVPVINKTGTITVQVSDEQAPNHMRLSVSRANVNATADLNLAPSGSGATLTYTAHADLSGPFSAVSIVAKPIVDSQLKQFFACLASKVS